jgi:hypothetical protein
MARHLMDSNQYVRINSDYKHSWINRIHNNHSRRDCWGGVNTRQTRRRVLHKLESRGGLPGLHRQLGWRLRVLEEVAHNQRRRQSII